MIFNLGSINADYFYAVPHLPQPGETLAATNLGTGLGGKGANLSVAVVRAGGAVRHIGAVGQDGAWALARLEEFGVDITYIATVDVPTGHAVINVDPSGENAIVIFAGANRAQTENRISAALGDARSNDMLVVQNETNGRQFAASCAKALGLRVFYAAAPFDEGSVASMLPLTDILVLNEIEFGQLRAVTGTDAEGLGVDLIVVTRGPKGVSLFERSQGWSACDIAAPDVDVVDTTGAGDTFAGYLAAGLDNGLSADAAARLAVRAAALQVTRRGTAEAIPTLRDVEAFGG